jgi:hypothetical protein
MRAIGCLTRSSVWIDIDEHSAGEAEGIWKIVFFTGLRFSTPLLNRVRISPYRYVTRQFRQSPAAKTHHKRPLDVRPVLYSGTKATTGDAGLLSAVVRERLTWAGEDDGTKQGRRSEQDAPLIKGSRMSFVNASQADS